MRSFTFGSQPELGGKIKWNNLDNFSFLICTEEEEYGRNYLRYLGRW